MAITDYDPIAGNNSTISGVNIAEGCSPAGINNAIRELMADVSGAALIDLFFPVGTIRISSDNTNPETYFPGTTWTQIAQGRAIVGVGDNGESIWTEGEQRGSETHVLTEGELPSHTHTDSFSVGNHNEDYSFQIRRENDANAIVSNGSNVSINNSGGNSTGIETSGASRSRHVVSWNIDHDHPLTGDIDSTGSDEPHNNVQPSEAHYVWERTA